MQFLPEERVMASETTRKRAEIDSNTMCNSHGSAALDEPKLLERRSLS